VAKQITVPVAEEQAGERMDKLLSLLPDIGSRAVAQKLIADGKVKVGDRTRAKNYRPAPGDVITVMVPEPERTTDLQPQDMNLAIPFEDEYLLIVDKPAGLVTHPAKGHSTGTLVHGLLGHQIAGGELPTRPGIVHRLDKDTSGLLIVAKDDITHRRLVEMMKNREISRTYMALVHGLLATQTGTIEAPIDRDATERKKMAIAGTGKGRQAVTHFQVLRTWSVSGRAPAARNAGGSDGFSLLEVRLDTGRTHQIRVHLAAIGHPVVGDRTYGRRRNDLGLERQFLHSSRLVFEHPQSGRKLDISSALPADLTKALEDLGSHSSEMPK
jgi:23S rRNA pseudouridine1911/1915/1917 synthase